MRLNGVDLGGRRMIKTETVGVILGTLVHTPFKVNNMVAAIFDRVATNYAAYSYLRGVAPNSFGIGCLSHTLVKPGAKAELPMMKALWPVTAITHGISLRLFTERLSSVIQMFDGIVCSNRRSNRQTSSQVSSNGFLHVRRKDTFPTPLIKLSSFCGPLTPCGWS